MKKAYLIISVLFKARSDAHLTHLLTTSYEQHITLGDLYNEISDFADKFTEIYMGKYGRMGITTLPSSIDNVDGTKICDTLISFFTAKIYDEGIISKESDKELVNLSEEFIGTLQHFKYRFTLK